MANPYVILRARDEQAQQGRHSYMTPAVKGQLTKARKVHSDNRANWHKTVLNIFSKLMPREQAKHATRKHLAEVL